jgi:hypothetical protein
MAYAPAAIQALFDTVKSRMPSAQLGGIYANKPGYHNARNQLPPSDYSVQTAPDKHGDPAAASALDITWGSANDQRTSSQRLLNAKNDSRMSCIREFFGSTDGVTVCGWDYYGGYPVTSDDSHLWHIHLSVLREYANDQAALAKVADVITAASGGGGSTPQEDEMKYASRVRSNPQTVGTDWKTLATNDDGNPGWDLTGPVKFQAQANVVISGLAAGEVLLLRFFTLDNKASQNQRVYNWPQIEIVGTAGNSNGSVVQFGSIGTPAAGWSRWLRLEAHTEKGSVTVAKLQSTSFSQ